MFAIGTSLKKPNYNKGQHIKIIKNIFTEQYICQSFYTQFIPRMISERAHKLTRIDIHP